MLENVQGKSVEEKEERYARLRREGKSPDTAYRLAFQSDGLEDMAPRSEFGLQTYMHQGRELLNYKFMEYAEVALTVMKNLSSAGTTDRIKLDASKFILEKALSEKEATFANFNIFNITDPSQLKTAIRDAILESAREQAGREAIDAEFVEA